MNRKQILELPTPRLLAYYKKHYRHNRNPYGTYWNHGPESPAKQAQWDEWEADQKAIKAELTIREHLEKK